MTTLTLTDFLLARIAEDEAVAKVMSPFDNAPRALAECEAKRRIVELADEATSLDMNVDNARRVGVRDMDAEPWLGDLMLAALALPYADHPDFREEWKP